MDFSKPISQIKELYQKYSFRDVSQALFIMDLWPPNMLSHVQHLLMTIILCSIKPQDFMNNESIKSYNDFNAFCKKLYKLSPSFPMLEDYIPEPDYGEIKIQLDNRDYKFLFGGIGDMYDYLTEYIMVYKGIEDEMLKDTGKSPLNELRQTLNAQDIMINDINAPAYKKRYKNLEAGYTDIAPESFWHQAINYLEKFDVAESFSDVFIDSTTLYTGNETYITKALLSSEKFGNAVMQGALMNFCFISDRKDTVPILPRSWLKVVISQWSNRLYENLETNTRLVEKIQMNTTVSMSQFVKDRILAYGKPVIELACSIDQKNKQPSKIVFTNAIFTDQKIILPYILPPSVVRGAGVDQEMHALFEDINGSINDIGDSNPLQIGDYSRGGTVQIETRDDEYKPEIIPLIIIPNLDINPSILGFTEEPPGIVMVLSNFMAIIDEIKDAKELSSFIDFLQANKKIFVMPDILDQYAAFKDSHGVIVEGANQPDIMWIDPNWGIRHRFKSLAKFWRDYPNIDIKLIRDKRTMAIDKAKTYTRIYKRNDPMLNFTIMQTRSSTGWVSSPFEEQKNKQDQMTSSSLMECVADYINRLEFLHSHSFFRYYTGYHIHIFPVRMITDEVKKFHHLIHLLPSGDTIWRMDAGFPEPDKPGVRIVIDIEKYIAASLNESTNKLEVKLISDIMTQFNDICHDKRFLLISKNLDRIAEGKPRFGNVAIKKSVSYPENTRMVEMTTQDHKLSRKHISLLAKSNNLKPGNYSGDIAKNILNKLKAVVVDDLNTTIAKLNYAKSITQAIAALEGFMFEHNRQKVLLEKSLEHDIDYDRDETFHKNEKEFIANTKSAKYLIEKLVQLEPVGDDGLSNNKIREILALIDKIFEIQGASDVIMYDIGSTKLQISREFVLSVSYGKKSEKEQRSYGTKEAQLKLGEIGKKDDAVKTFTSDSKNYMNELDHNFKNDFGFTLSTMAGVLNTLSRWAALKNCDEDEYYSASKDEIINICARSIKPGFNDRSDIEKSLEFILLHDVLKIEGGNRLSSDIPIWEYNKRHNRYNIKPVIKIENVYYWGPNSAHTAAGIWFNSALELRMPSNIAGTSTNAFLEAKNTNLEKRIEDKADDIVSRFTKHRRKNLKSGRTHPNNIGEYDVLAYIESSNIILNIECKDIKPPFCYKDAKRVREKIFGGSGKNKGYLHKVELRGSYLKESLSNFENELHWGIKPSAKIVSIFVTRYMYYWTECPPIKTDVTFTPIELLEQVISSLK